MAGITHKWNGTVLTITSDSGTSSADLKGEKGDDGARGAQGSVCDVAVMANYVKDYVAANAAPKGYGYGGSVPYVSVADMWTDTAYNTALDGLLSGMNDGEAKQIRIPYIDGTTTYGNVFKTTNDYATVVCYGYGTNGIIARKTKYNGYWHSWEWENPPLITGTAYRTTERYNGAAVYQKLVYIANLPNNSSKNIDSVIESGITHLVDLQYTINNSWTKKSNDSRVDITLGIENPYAWLTITTTADLSTYSGYVLIKWTRE